MSKTTDIGAPLDLDKLEALARAATPGEWSWEGRKVDPEDGYVYIPECSYLVGGISLAFQHEGYQNDCDFMAAANPAAVLALIALARCAAPSPQSASVDAIGQDERALFEAAFIARVKARDPLRKYGDEDVAMYLARNSNDESRYLHAQEAWEGWQARAALAHPSVSPAPEQEPSHD